MPYILIKIVAFAFLFVVFVQFDLEESVAGVTSRHLFIFLLSFPLVLILQSRSLLNLNWRVVIFFTVSLGSVAINSLLFDESELIYLAMYLANGFVLILFFSWVKENHNIFISVVKILTDVIFLGFALQFMYYILTKNHLDLHQMLFPFSRESVILESRNYGFVRFNGFMIEAGNYSQVLGLLMLIVLINRKRFHKWDLLKTLSIPMTMSMSGIGGFMLLSCILYSKLQVKDPRVVVLTAMASVVAFFIVFFSLGLDEYIVERYMNNSRLDGSTYFKYAAIIHWFEADIQRKLLGCAFMVSDNTNLEFVNSAGILFSMFYYLGIYGVLIFLIAFMVVGPYRKGPLVFMFVYVVAGRWALNNIITLFIFFYMVQECAKCVSSYGSTTRTNKA